jgi:hypothetical protein
MRNKLTPTAIHKTKRVGYHSDGGGLYLRVTRAGTRSWIFRRRDTGRLRDMGLGAVDCASLRTVAPRSPRRGTQLPSPGRMSTPAAIP